MTRELHLLLFFLLRFHLTFPSGWTPVNHFSLHPDIYRLHLVVNIPWLLWWCPNWSCFHLGLFSLTTCWFHCPRDTTRLTRPLILWPSREFLYRVKTPTARTSALCCILAVLCTHATHSPPSKDSPCTAFLPGILWGSFPFLSSWKTFSTSKTVYLPRALYL